MRGRPVPPGPHRRAAAGRRHGARRRARRCSSDASRPSRTTGWMKRGGSSAASTSTTHEAGGQRRPPRRLDAGDRRRVAQRAAVSEHGERLREGRAREDRGRARARPPAARSPRRPPPAARPDRPGRGRLVGCDRPQQLGQVKGIAAACRPDRRAELIVGPPPIAARTIVATAASLNSAGRTTIDASARSAASDALGRRRLARRAARPAAPAPAPPAAARGRPATAARARPPSARHRRRPTAAGAAARLAASQYRPCKTANDVSSAGVAAASPSEQRPHRGSGSGEQCLALWGFGAREPPLEQLAHDAEGEVRLELRPAGAQDLVATLLRLPAGRVDQRRLPDARPTLDHEHLAAAFQQRVDRRELAFALDQLVHRTTLDPRRRAGARLPDGRPALPVAKDGEQGGASAPVRGWCAGGRTPCRRRWRCSRRRRSCRPRRARDPGRTRPGRGSRP